MPNIHRYDCYSTGLLTTEKIAELRQSMAPALFAANYELQHIASGDAIFDTQPRYTDEEELIWDGISHVDPAYGGGDYTAFTCGKLRDGVMYLYGRMWQKHVDQCMAEIMAEAERLRCLPCYCEANGDKGFLVNELRKHDFYAKGYTESQNKFIKITTYLRKYWGKVVFLEGTDPEYVRQILDYTEQAEHDDAADSAACVCRLQSKWDW